jgi:hypothetical protein
MIKLLVGLVVGLILGTAMSALAVSGWYSGKEMADKSTDVQGAYAAGVFDAVASIVDAQMSLSSLRTQFNCLDTKGDRLGDFRTWAMSKINQHPDGQAASSVIGGACEP